MSIELNVYGKFLPGPWKDNAAIVAAAQKREWSPDTAELMTFASTGAGKVAGVGDVFALLCAIIRIKPNRVNIFSHANADFLYLSGKVIPGNVEWDTSKPQNSLDVDYLAGLEQDGNTTFSDTITKNATFPQFRAAFQSPASICIYACHAGVGQRFSAGIADYFQCSVRAFKDEVRYYVALDKKGGLIRSYSIGNKDQVTKFHDLDKNFLAPVYPSGKKPAGKPGDDSDD